MIFFYNLFITFGMYLLSSRRCILSFSISSWIKREHISEINFIRLIDTSRSNKWCKENDPTCWYRIISFPYSYYHTCYRGDQLIYVLLNCIVSSVYFTQNVMRYLGVFFQKVSLYSAGRSESNIKLYYQNLLNNSLTEHLIHQLNNSF